MTTLLLPPLVLGGGGVEYTAALAGLNKLAGRLAAEQVHEGATHATCAIQSFFSSLSLSVGELSAPPPAQTGPTPLENYQRRACKTRRPTPASARQVATGFQ